MQNTNVQEYQTWAVVSDEITNNGIMTLSLPATLANSMLAFEFYNGDIPITTNTTSGSLVVTGKYKNGRNRNVATIDLANVNEYPVLGLYSSLTFSLTNLVGCSRIVVYAAQYANIVPSGAGGGDGATSLVVTSPNSSVAQVGASTYDSVLKKITVALTAVGGGLGMKQINNYFIDVVSSNVTFTYQAIGGALTTVALTGIVNGDNLTDISYDGTGGTNGNYWLCSEGGNIYSSPANAATPFQNWTLVFSAGVNYPLFAIASAAGASGYTCAMGSGNYIVNNKSSTWQINTPSFPINVRKINSVFFSLTGQCNILGTGTVSGTMVFAGVDSAGKGCYVATGGSSASFLTYWCSGEISFVNATVNQIIYANPTVGGWIMACNFGNICYQEILGTGAIASVAPQGQPNQPYNSISYDGTNLYVASSSGYMGYFKANIGITAKWTAITIANFVPSAVASEAVTPFATIFAGTLNGTPTVAVSTTPSAPSFTTEVIPLYLNLPYLFSDTYSDKRLASRGYVKSLFSQTGKFSPILTCDTVGDLSVSYASKNARYTVIGNRCFVDLIVLCTPTYTTASGNWYIGGFPFAYVNDNMSPSYLILYPIGIYTNSSILNFSALAFKISNPTLAYILVNGNTQAVASIPSGRSIELNISFNYQIAPLT